MSSSLISDNLFLAILSMDSYNREYQAGIAVGGSSIGNATIKDHEASGVTTSEYQAWKDAGFYAIAYEIKDDSIEGLANGQKVISYRGTDSPGSWSNLIPWSTTPGGDAWNGWSVGVCFGETPNCQII